MQITFTIEATPENIEKLKVFCTEEKVQFPAKNTKAKTSKKADTPTEDNPPFDMEAANEELPESSGTPEISKSDVRAVALKLSKAGKSNVLKEIFAKFGAEKLGDVPEDKYSELMRELVSANE
mgnify:CR=1 FL=1